MHCPRCGQQQVSDEIKFCSRCGLPLGIVAEVLLNNGELPQLNELQKNKPRFTRKFGLKLAFLWFIFFSFILLPLAAITDAPEVVVTALGVMGFSVGFVIALMSWLFLPKETKPLKNSLQNEQFITQQLSGNRENSALPPQTSQPVSSYVPPSFGSWKAPDTGELVPFSVTDNTTKLLQKDE